VSVRIDTIAAIVRTHSEAAPDRIALRCADRSLTYAELDTITSRTANALAALGVGKGDRVVFLDHNSVDHFVVFFAAAKLGAIFVPVNWRLSASEIAAVIADSGAATAIIGTPFLDTIVSVRAALPAVENLLGCGVARTADSIADLYHLVSSAPVDDPGTPVSGDDVAVLLYSSGTTGRPKGVMLTHDGLIVHSGTTAAMWRIDKDAQLLAAMPLFHVGGGGWALTGLFRGAGVTVLREVTAATTWRALVEGSVTHTFFVPAMIQQLLAADDRPSRDQLNLEVLLYGASPIAVPVLREAIALFGPVFIQGYGLTEGGGSLAHLSQDDHDPSEANIRLGSCGRPDPGVELRIVAPDSWDERAPYEVGEIVVRSSQNMRGYWNLESETSAALTADNWLRTGDAGYLDDHGYIYLHDRIKDMIVAGGENVYPAEIENVVMAHPDVNDVAVVGAPHQVWGETPMAFVVRRPGSALSEQDVIDYCREHLARYKCPTQVSWLDELPRNAAGKLLKRDLRSGLTPSVAAGARAL
jgi:long-chain acyl-CoA synthetase